MLAKNMSLLTCFGWSGSGLFTTRLQEKWHVALELLDVVANYPSLLALNVKIQVKITVSDCIYFLQASWVWVLLERASWLMLWFEASQLQVILYFTICAIILTCLDVYKDYNQALKLFLDTCHGQGVIATHRITASSPDTDQTTVQQLRVGRHFNGHSSCNQSVGSVWQAVCNVNDESSSVCFFKIEIGSKFYHQQQGDGEQMRCPVPGCEAPHHPLRPRWDWTRYWGASPDRLLCCRGHYQLHREGES